MSQVFLQLEPSERTVTLAAAQIYAAYIAAGKVAEGDEGRWMQKAIGEAIQIAYHTDQAVQSDGETSKNAPRSF